MWVRISVLPLQPEYSYCSFDRFRIPREEASKTTQLAKELFPDLRSYSKLDYKTLKGYLKREQSVSIGAFHLDVRTQPRSFVIANVKAMKCHQINIDGINLKRAIFDKNGDLLTFLLNNSRFKLNGAGIALKNPLSNEVSPIALPLSNDDSPIILPFYKFIRFAIEHSNLEMVKILTSKFPVSLRNLKHAIKKGDYEMVDFLADIIDERIKYREICGDRQSMQIENEGAHESPSFGDIAKAIARADIDSVRIYLEKTPPSKWHLIYAEYREALDLETQEVRKEDPFEISRLIRTKL